MNSVRAFTLAAVWLLISGCATDVAKLGDVRSGMNENQVRAILGRPYVATLNGNKRVLHYRLADLPVGRGHYDFPHDYFVTLENDRVIATDRQGPTLQLSGAVDVHLH